MDFILRLNFSSMNSKDYRYQILLFKNKKKVKILKVAQKLKTIMRYWQDIKGTVKPRFTVEYKGRDGTARNQKVNYELVLLYPPNKRVKTGVYVKDELGRIKEAKICDENYRIKEIFPFWMEEKIFDLQANRHIRYHELLEKILTHQEIGQIFKLNTKLIVQIDDNFEIYEVKNLNDSNRLFDLVREDILEKKRGNYLFVKDVSSSQRSYLYKILVNKGYKWSWLVKHYSY